MSIFWSGYLLLELISTRLALHSMMGMQSSKEKIAELNDNLAKKLDVYDQILSKQRYLTGEVAHPSTVN